MEGWCDLTDVPGTAAWWQKLRTVTVRSSEASREPSRKRVGLELVTEDVCVDEVLSWAWEEDQRLLSGAWSVDIWSPRWRRITSLPEGWDWVRLCVSWGRELLSFV